MSESTAAAVIGACALVVTAVLALIGVVISNRRQLLAQRQDVAVIREQVTNSHSTNLREEGDERHGENSRRLIALERGQKTLTRSIGRIEDHLGIEHTVPRSRVTPTRRTR